MFGIGAGEFILILIVGLIVFGPSKLPEVGRSLGKAIREFRKAQAALSNALSDTEAQLTSQPPRTQPTLQPSNVQQPTAQPPNDQPSSTPVEPKRTTVDDVTNMINANPITVPPSTDKINLSKPEAVKESA